jgi:hypothetical protein
MFNLLYGLDIHSGNLRLHHRYGPVVSSSRGSALKAHGYPILHELRSHATHGISSALIFFFSILALDSSYLTEQYVRNLPYYPLSSVDEYASSYPLLGVRFNIFNSLR